MLYSPRRTLTHKQCNEIGSISADVEARALQRQIHAKQNGALLSVHARYRCRIKVKVWPFLTFWEYILMHIFMAGGTAIAIEISGILFHSDACNSCEDMNNPLEQGTSGRYI